MAIKKAAETQPPLTHSLLITRFLSLVSLWFVVRDTWLTKTGTRAE